MNGKLESLVREEMNINVRRKSISRELRKNIMGGARRIIGLQPVEQKHITCFLKDGFDRYLNSVDNKGGREAIALNF